MSSMSSTLPTEFPKMIRFISFSLMWNCSVSNYLMCVTNSFLSCFSFWLRLGCLALIIICCPSQLIHYML